MKKIEFSLTKDNDEIINEFKHEKISSNKNNDASLYKISYMKNDDFEEKIVVKFEHNENKYYSTKIQIPNDYTNIFYYDNKWECTKNKSILIPINLSQMFDEFCNIQEDNLVEDLYPQTLEKVKGEKDFELFMKLFI